MTFSVLSAVLHQKLGYLCRPCWNSWLLNI